MLYSSLLGRTAAVMRHGRHVPDHHDLDPALGQGTDGAFATGTGAFHEYIHTLQTGIKGGLGGIRGGHLRGIGSVLFGTLESHLTGAAPGDHLAGLVGQADDDVVECGGDMRITVRIYFYHSFFGSSLGAYLLL